MLLAETYLGHREDPDVSLEEPRRVVLSDTERRRSRVRTETVGGREVGIVVGRDLGDGDVLGTDDGGRLVVELATVEAVAVDLGALPPDAALQLGHDLGNHHWDLAVEDGEAFVPVADSRERMEEALDRLLPAGVGYRDESVPPTMFDSATAPDHEHSHGQDHDTGHATAYRDLRGEES